MKTLNICCLLLCGLFSSAQFTSTFLPQNYDKYFVKASLPADLKSNGHILLVRTPFEARKTKQNEKLNTILAENYNGKFVIVPLNDYSKSFKDTAVYKYELLMVGRGGPHPLYSFFIVDQSRIFDASGTMNRAAAVDTGLEDGTNRVDDMLRYLVGKMNELKE